MAHCMAESPPDGASLGRIAMQWRIAWYEAFAVGVRVFTAP
jgi:hypothetical protein